DGDLDLLVNSIGGGTRLFINDGKGKFTESIGGRLTRRFASMSMALADVDRDGDLDFYVANYRTLVANDELPRVKVEARVQNGQVTLNPPGRFVALPAKGGNVEVLELAERDFLYMNTGNGNFAPVSWTNGNFLDVTGQTLRAAPLDWGLSVMMRDLNDDGLIDIIVCNDFFNSPDRIWMQEAGFKFRAASLAAVRKVSLASMSVDVADINGDGLDDLFFVEMLSRDHGFSQNHRDNIVKAAFNTRVNDPAHRWEVARNTLFLNMGDGTYSEIAELAGLDASEWSWGAVFLDVDLDGKEDVLIPSGHNHDVLNADVLRGLGKSGAPDSYEQRVRDLQQFPRLATPILAFRNESNRGSIAFREMQESWGLNIPGVANGFACGDLDNDGDLDLVVNRLNDAALIFRNDVGRERIGIRLAGTGANTRGVGAKLIVRGGPHGMVQSQHMIAGGRYLSSDDFIRVFAANAGEPLEVEVRWPNDTRTVLAGLKPNAVYEISQKGALPFRRPENISAPFFKDVSQRLNHRSVDPAFDDFERQPFLPYSLATQGPALAWADLNGDGADDLLIGAARGGRMAIRQNAGTNFNAVTNRLTGRVHLDDQMGMVVTQDGTNEPSVIQAFSNYESGARNSPSVEIGSSMVLPGQLDTSGALALADIDADGDLDLFVAGRVLPGRYPAAASSRVYLRSGGGYEFSPEFSRPFEQIGLVASAQFSDFNNDGRPDLVLGLEWGPVRVYINSGTTFVHENRGLEDQRGWWTSVVTGDFNNDGLTDIVAGNWGANTKYQRFIAEKPLRMVHGDLDGNGKYDVFPAIFNPNLRQYVPVVGPEIFIEHFPIVAERIPNYEAFARATMEELLGGAKGQTLEINRMESTCFINRGTTFEAVSLPLEAQFAPVFGMAVADFDHDGNEDLVLGQSLFETRWEMGRLDSGRPLWLRGDGRGGFRTSPPAESGLAADGQQRAVAIADFNRDGRMDVAISQNNGETKLFENALGEAGARIRFSVGAGNPDGIGVRYRVIAGASQTPIREVQAGGGWLSQNSAVHTMKKPPTGARLHVAWPGGKKSEFELAAGAAEYSVSESSVKVIR
ncbi:MAG: FG-GAP-like repeat-containing protein, partial [Limisphaerales bacterium]